MKKFSHALTLVSLLCIGCNTSQKATSTKETQPSEKSGWIALFDGSNLNHWRNYNKNSLGNLWAIDEGCLHLRPNPDKDPNLVGGDIITKGEYGDYILELEWKISPCGNSGIMHHIHEDEDLGAMYLTGPEMQILHDSCLRDRDLTKHRAGDLYDMIASEASTVNPVGHWNEVRIKTKGGQTTYWLNGQKVVEFSMWTAEWDELIANSKFKDWASFGQFKKGHIGLQDHGNEVWFKNIRIKEI